MKVYSVIYRASSQAYHLYNREGGRIVPDSDPPIMGVGTAYGFKYGFSFLDNWNDENSVEWSQLMEGLEIEDGMEYFYDAEKVAGTMTDIMSRVTAYWLDRGKTDTATLPNLVVWARRMMIDPERHEDPEKISRLYVEEEAVTLLKTIFDRYKDLVKGRQYQNYGHDWPNVERLQLLQKRIAGLKFKDIAKQMGRTDAAARSEYGRIRRGKHNVTLDLDEWEMFRLTLPLGAFPDRNKEPRVDNATNGSRKDRSV